MNKGFLMKKAHLISIGSLTFALCLLFTMLVESIVVDSSTLNSDSSNRNIVEIAESTPDLSTFVQALNAATLAATLETPGPFTVFAPSNEAFAALPQTDFQELMKKENKSRLASILKNHVVKGSFTTDKLNAGNMNSLGSKPIHISIHGSQITIDDANIVQPDLVGSNGVIQIIDTVLLTK